MEVMITNKGYAETTLVNNNKRLTNKSNWVGTYDGENGNLDLETETNGHKNNINIEFTNKDLENLLSMQTVEEPIEKRLRNDFEMSRNQDNPLIGREMMKQILNEEVQDSFPLVIKKYNMDILTPRRQHKRRYNVTMKRNIKSRHRNIRTNPTTKSKSNLKLIKSNKSRKR